MSDHGWIDASKPRVGPLRPRLAKGDVKKDARPMPLPTATDLKTLAHATCVDHVDVEGLSKPVCVRRGQDPRDVAREARQLAGLDR